MTPKELFAIIDKRWKWVAKDKNGSIFLYEVRPHLETIVWDTSSASFTFETTQLLPTIDFGTDDWARCIARRDEIDMDEVARIFEHVWDLPISKRGDALTAVVEYVRKQLEQEGL